jgi:hypothetical protein
MSPIQIRINRLESRIRKSICPFDIACLVKAMTEELDPEAIASLIGLLDHAHDAKESVERALLRYGEAAEESLRAHVAAGGSSTTRVAAQMLLRRMELRARLAQVGCF